MKKALVLAITLGAVGAIQPQSARADLSTQTKQEVTALTATATGAVAGGPIGALLGLAVGAWLVDEVGRAGERDMLSAELAARQTDLDAATYRVAELEHVLGKARKDQDRLARSMLESLEVALMFRTGDAALSTAGKSRLNTLARYVRRNPDLEVRVQGHTDPRGAEDTNLALSRARAEAVAEQLRAAGVGQSQLRIDAHGEQRSVAASGDLDAMALERRVVIELVRPRGLAIRSSN